MASMKMGVVVVLVAAMFCFVGSAQGQGKGDPNTTNYTIVAQSGGGPEVARCIGQNRCYQKLLYCPLQCPSRSTLGSKKACFIDCGTRCETTCKQRKPNCYGFGAACYDPRLIGGDGSLFYFHGEKDQSFCLVTDRDLHINGHMIGLRPEGRSRDFTWVQALGLLFGSHQFSVGAKKVAEWDENVDQFFFAFDGMPFEISEEVGATWVSEDGLLRVERTYQRNVVEVVVPKMLSVLIQVRPITPAEDKAHKYSLPKGDVFAHLDLQFKFFNLSANVNGVLGQTYQPGYVSLAKVGVPMPVLGGEDRFSASGLLNHDCQANQFTPETERTSEPVQLETLLPVQFDCSSEATGKGIVCRR